MTRSTGSDASPLSEEELRAIFHSTNDAIAVHDGETGEILDVNRTLCEMYGYSREDARDLTVEDLSSGVEPYTQDEAMRYVRQAAEGEPQVFEWHAQDSDGDLFWVEVSMRQAVVDGESRILVTVRDIEERKLRERKLEEQRELHSLLVEQSPSGVVIVQDGEYKFVNSAMADLTGYPAAELEGRPLAYIVAPEYRDLVESRYGQRISGEGPPQRYDIEIVDSDGERHHIDLQVAATTYEGDPATLATFHDITERKEAEKRLRRQNERLENFASVVSHDLRNPLTVAQARVEMLDGEADHVDSIQRNLDRMEAIVDDVLTLAQQGQAIDEMETLSLELLAAHAWDHVDSADATLTVTANRRFEGDRSRCRQLFENLFRNSLEHGGPAVAVEVGPLDDGFYVADDGPGIPPSERDEVFEAGYTTNSQGTGFGLNIVQEIAHAHGWAVSVTDGRDGGARFEFTDISDR